MFSHATRCLAHTVQGQGVLRAPLPLLCQQRGRLVKPHECDDIISSSQVDAILLTVGSLFSKSRGLRTVGWHARAHKTPLSGRRWSAPRPPVSQTALSRPGPTGAQTPLNITFFVAVAKVAELQRLVGQRESEAELARQRALAAEAESKAAQNELSRHQGATTRETSKVSKGPLHRPILPLLRQLALVNSNVNSPATKEPPPERPPRPHRLSVSSARQADAWRQLERQLERLERKKERKNCGSGQPPNAPRRTLVSSRKGSRAPSRQLAFRRGLFGIGAGGATCEQTCVGAAGGGAAVEDADGDGGDGKESHAGGARRPPAPGTVAPAPPPPLRPPACSADPTPSDKMLTP
eukprot:1184266-Prorocentrum_minimum.AAC.2